MLLYISGFILFFLGEWGGRPVGRQFCYILGALMAKKRFCWLSTQQGTERFQRIMVSRVKVCLIIGPMKNWCHGHFKLVHYGVC